MKRVLFPGSFDPFTIGHEKIALRCLDLFDEVVIGVANNASKKGMLSVEQRVLWIQTVFAQHPNVIVQAYSGLTVNFCQRINAKFMVRGIRNTIDLEYERSIADINKKITPEIETVFLLAPPECGAISSTILREIIINNGDVKQFLPTGITEALFKEYFK